MTTVTRTLHATTDSRIELRSICKAMALVRADIWRRYGALGTVGKNAAAIRKDITAHCWYSKLPVDGTIRAETTKDAVNDLLTYKAAATQKVRQAIARRTNDQNERKQLYTQLKADDWLDHSYLHRMMRKHFRHGVSHCNNQFVVRSDRHSEQIIDGRLVVTITIARQYGSDIQLITTSSGKNVNLRGRNLRIIVNCDQVEINYTTEKVANRPCGSQELGVDKGYSEALTDSDGVHYGVTFGDILTRFSDCQSKTGKSRNKLHTLEKKHRAAGRISKADRIQRNNLGRTKLDSRRTKTQQHLRTIAYQAAHQVVDKAAVVASEDLTAPIRGKAQWRRFNRRMSAWAKGVLAQALDEVCTQRGAVHITVNAAYTSQMDSFTGLLEGKRVGDKFYRVTGDVIQADYNAARNVKARIHDPDITRYMPHLAVRQVLLSRSSGATERQEALVGRCKPRQRSADKSKMVNND